MPHIYGSELSDELDLKLGLMGAIQRMYQTSQLVEMGFDRQIVEALMQNSLTPIENADQAIDIMFNPQRHRFFPGADITDVIAARVNRETKNC